MTTPIPGLNSSINIRLNAAPKVDDPVLYEALLDIHGAIEALVRKYDSITSGLTQVGLGIKLIAGDPGTESAGISIAGTTYDSSLKVSDLAGNNLTQLILHRHSTLYSPAIVGARSNSNTSAHANVIAGQELLSAYAAGYIGSSYKLFGSFSFKVDSTGILSETSAPGNFVLSITPNGGISPIEALNITNTGDVTLAKQLIVPQLGVGVSAPTASLHLKAGVATANTAPIKLTSGALNTSPEVGAIEFLLDKYYAVITTGASRKEFTLNDTILTPGRIPIVAANGRLIDDLDLIFDTDTLISTKLKSQNPLQQITTGTASVAGNAVLVAGTATVNTTAVKANSIVSLTRKTNGGVIGTETYSIINGVSFTITSSSATDTSTFSWLITDTY